ncbi:MAG: YggS family pyridoxal phosphate-dependent enzyme [Betaproteobacteria bacterium]|nr:YggS family pyridoxal phosphate-dependent enzyme [Betaproteobacteria bacterium]
MTTISANLQAVKNRIRAAAQSSGRDVGAARLLAVSKTWPAASVRAAFAAGQRAFGENYVQEGVAKIAALDDLELEWHFIGPLQSNKTREVAEHFDWVHSVDRLRIAERLAAQRPPGLPPLQVCVQVNVSGETSKGGVAPDQAVTLARAVAGLPSLPGLPGLRLRGLMTIPEPSGDAGLLRRRYTLLRELLAQLNAGGMKLDVLSMGMSDDFEIAIAEGATIVRIGTAIFGQRTREDNL